MYIIYCIAINLSLSFEIKSTIIYNKYNYRGFKILNLNNQILSNQSVNLL
jgi:hypothetical protein